LELTLEIKKEAKEGRLREDLKDKKEDKVKEYVRDEIEKKCKRLKVEPRYSNYVTKSGNTTNGWREEGIIRYNYWNRLCWAEEIQLDREQIDKEVLDKYREQPEYKKKDRTPIKVDEGPVRKSQKASVVKTETFNLKLRPSAVAGKTEQEINEELRKAGMDPDEFWESLNENAVEYTSGNDSDDEGSTYEGLEDEYADMLAEQTRHVDGANTNNEGGSGTDHDTEGGSAADGDENRGGDNSGN
jgi:hypothetical protein